MFVLGTNIFKHMFVFFGVQTYWDKDIQFPMFVPCAICLLIVEYKRETSANPEICLYDQTYV